LMMPLGLLWYGWSAQTMAPWIMVDLGAAIFTCGGTVLVQGLLAYLLDEFEHAAAANAASRMLSNLFGFAFPIFAPQLDVTLGYGGGNTVIALLSAVLGVPAVACFWFWGPRLRAVGKKPGESDGHNLK